MELRDDNSNYSKKLDSLRAYFANYEKIKLNKSKIVFQQKGLSNLEKDALSRYARILVNYKKR